jgi:Ni,Fe-hydrogenase I large subunit
LRGDPPGFAARPRLAGRRPETGAYARLWRRSPSQGSVLSARLAARFNDIRLALTAVGQGLQLGEMEFDEVLAAGAVGANAGYGAVESARGRLYHWAEIGADERIAAYAIVAPTEWNFHAAGPFVAALLGARVGQGETARLAVTRLATLFDPCVAFDVALKEPVRA